VQEQSRAGRPRDVRLDEAIIDATISLLTERGYGEMSLAAIAERASTTTAAIYRRWGSKSELVAYAVFRTEGDDVVADTGDLAADLATMIRWAAEKLYRPAAVAAIAGLLSEPRSDRRERASSAAAASGLVVERLERARAAGEVDERVNTSVLAALIDGPLLHAAFSGATDVDDEWIDDLVRIILVGVLPLGAPATSDATDADVISRAREKESANR
jgi:AcrR family transcriptional regulator